MKKIAGIVILFILGMSIAYSQSIAIFSAEGTYYKVYSEISQAHAEETVKKMDAYFTFFNGYFHFDPATLGTKMKVKIFSSRESYDKYLARIVPNIKNAFVYLQYKNEEKSELVGFIQEDDENAEAVLVHHSFIQFLKSFIYDPPLWVQKGFAIFFEKSSYISDQKKVVYKENLSWLETLKDYIVKSNFDKMISDLFPLQTLLTLDVESANNRIDVFYAESWGLVSFLVNSEFKIYNRVLWDSIALLEKENTRKQNEANLQKYAFSWINQNLMQADILDYIDNVKTFPELVQLGMDSYTAEEYDKSEAYFQRALALDNTHYIPYYYLGLIYYTKNDYALAEYYYHSSIQMGGNQGLAYYALGVNSFADNRFDDAIFYLEQSNNIDPKGYGLKALALITRIKEEVEALQTFGDNL